ncbi:MAG: hypothetical protein P9L97_10490 [Candidatus Tenebribacter davisii]|nr:hypothetical protein [Candidatus Tenebribacter davisii]
MKTNDNKIRAFTQEEKGYWERLIKLSIKDRGLSWKDISVRQDLEDENKVRFAARAMPTASFSCTKDYLLQFDSGG